MSNSQLDSLPLANRLAQQIPLAKLRSIFVPHSVHSQNKIWQHWLYQKFIIPEGQPNRSFSRRGIRYGWKRSPKPVSELVKYNKKRQYSRIMKFPTIGSHWFFSNAVHWYGHTKYPGNLKSGLLPSEFKVLLHQTIHQIHLQLQPVESISVQTVNTTWASLCQVENLKWVSGAPRTI